MEADRRGIKVKDEVPAEDDLIVIVDKDKEQRNEKMKKVIEQKEALAEEAFPEQELASRVSRSGKIAEDGFITYDNERHIPTYNIRESLVRPGNGYRRD